MKKTVAALFAGLTVAAFGGVNDLLVMFSTPGPDKYADGTQVIDNECYALVYTKGDKQETVLTFPGAKDGKCPPVLFSIDEEDAAKNYQGGTWGVYLLDTRDFEKDPTGKTLSGIDEAGQPKVVNVKASVEDGIASSGGFNSASAQAGVAAGAYDLTDVPQPKVTGIKIVGANVVVTVANTRPFVGYTLQSGSDVSNFAVPADTASVSGDAAKEINLVTPKKDGAQFFKVSTIK